MKLMKEKAAYHKPYEEDDKRQGIESDITSVATREGWLYLAVILDFFSRLGVGWKVGESLEAGLVVTALQNALSQREPPRGLIFHSDSGRSVQ